MYGSLFYNRKSSKINWTEYDEHDKRHKFSLKWVPNFYIESREETKYKSLDGLYLKPIKTTTWSKRRELLKEYKDSGQRVFGSDLPAEDLYILEKWKETITVVPEVHFAFIDIETEVSNGFPYPDQALERVNLITVYSNRKKKFVVFGLEHDYVNTREDVVYLKCETEELLLQRYVKYIEGLGIDILSGWNSSGFDVPYLFNRILKVLDGVDLELFNKYLNYKDRADAPKDDRDKWAEENQKLNWIKRLSPYKHIEKKRTKSKDRFTKELVDSMGYNIHGLTDYDYLLLYQQFQMGQKESYKLDYIGELELGERKLDYDGTFKDFYTKDWQTFVDYNIQDVNLLVKLDHKLNYITQAITLSYKCHCQFKENLSTVMKMEVAIYNFLEQRGIIMEDDWNADERHSESFPGAYVKDPIPGMYEYILDFDIASLYPSLMRGINISPDVKKFTIYNETPVFDLDPKEIVSIKWQDYWEGHNRINGKEEELTASEVVDIIKKNRYSISSANVVFEDQSKQKGILVEILDMWYADRKKFKKSMNECKTSSVQLLKNAPSDVFEGSVVIDTVIDDEKVTKYLTVEENERYEEFLRLYGVYHNLQWACKILLNSLYGTISTKFCRFYDIDLARSVTMSGQTVIKTNGNMMNDYFAEDIYNNKAIRKKYNINDEFKVGEVLKYIDTDSTEKNAMIRTNKGAFKIETLFEMFESKKHYSQKGHEIVYPRSKDLKCLTYNETFKKVELGGVKKIVRHKVTKGKWKISGGGKEVIVTEDHSCMVLREGILIEIKPRDIKKTDKLIVLK